MPCSSDVGDEEWTQGRVDADGRLTHERTLLASTIPN